MYDLEISDSADRDLDAIVQYLVIELANPVAAVSFLDKLEDVYSYLKASPRMYSLCDEKRLKAKGYRKVVIGNYILVFRVEEPSRCIRVLRFFYGGQDYLSSL